MFFVFDKDLKLLKSLGKTTILTSEGFVLSGNKSLSDDLKWLMNQANSATAEKELISKGIEAIKFDIKLTAGL